MSIVEHTLVAFACSILCILVVILDGGDRPLTEAAVVLYVLALWLYLFIRV